MACVPQRLDLPAAAGPAAALCLALLGDSAPSAGAALRRGWLSSIVGMAAVLYWLTIPIPPWATCPWPWRRSAPCWWYLPGQRRRPVQPAGPCPARARPLAQAWLLGLAWYFLEYVYALVAGFPWLPLGGALAAWPLGYRPPT